MNSKIIYLLGGGLLLARGFASPPQIELKKVNEQINHLQETIRLEKNRSLFLKKNLEKSNATLVDVEKNLVKQKNLVKKQQREIDERQKAIEQDHQVFDQTKEQLNRYLTKWYLAPKNVTWLNEGTEVFNVLRAVYLNAWCQQQQKFLTKKGDRLFTEQGIVEQIIEAKNKATQSLGSTEKVRLKLKTENQQNQLNLVQLDRNLKIKQTNLNKLLQEKKNLERLIADLIKKTTPTNSAGAFSGHWPGKYKVIVKFGTKIQNTEWRHNNLILQMEDKEFKAVAAGKVIFAGPLKGYGLLLILDHQNGFVSVYGNACKLYKLAGFYVAVQEKLGEVIKQDDQYRLYFAIKKEGKAVDPEKVLINH